MTEAVWTAVTTTMTGGITDAVTGMVGMIQGILPQCLGIMALLVGLGCGRKFFKSFSR